MNRALIGTVLALGVVGIVGHAVADKKAAAPAAPAKPACGVMMKSMAPLPTKFAELMNSVADQQAAHAAMLTGKDPASVAEAAAMKKISQDHRDMGTAAKKAAADLDAAGSLAPVANEGKPDAKGIEAMQKTVALEKEMAAMMVKDAENTEKAIAQMKGATAAK